MSPAQTKAAGFHRLSRGFSLVFTTGFLHQALPVSESTATPFGTFGTQVVELMDAHKGFDIITVAELQRGKELAKWVKWLAGT